MSCAALGSSPVEDGVDQVADTAACAALRSIAPDPTTLSAVFPSACCQIVWYGAICQPAVGESRRLPPECGQLDMPNDMGASGCGF